jgi:steroid delta-isomerase-like uncharacterized protein
MADNAELIRRFYDEVLGNGNLDMIDEMATEDIVDHEEGLPGQPPGIEGVKFFITALRNAFPDIRAEVDVTLSDGDLAAARTIARGTHQGEFLGVPPSNKSVEFEGIDIIRVEDGKVAEHWGVTDTMSLMQQIGAIPG